MAPGAASTVINDLPTLYTQQAVPGKGQGLIATKSISPGTCIIREIPLFTTEGITEEKQIAAIVKALPKEGQRAFLTLHNNNPGKDPFSNIIRSNAYPLGSNSDVGGVFPTVARINHSCKPNCQQAWNSMLKKETVYAVRNIAPGEEITMSYHVGGTSSERGQILKQFFGFSCACELCSLPEEQLKQSDARQLRAQKLDEAIGDPKRARMIPERALDDCRSLLKVFEEEDVQDSRIHRAYYDAFQLCNMHGDQARAKVFAQRCLDKRVQCEGPDSPDVLEMVAIIKAPSKHSSFGSTKKWAQQPDQVPQNPDPADFDKWLWREIN